MTSARNVLKTCTTPPNVRLIEPDNIPKDGVIGLNGCLLIGQSIQDRIQKSSNLKAFGSAVQSRSDSVLVGGSDMKATLVYFTVMLVLCLCDLYFRSCSGFSKGMYLSVLALFSN